jgi:hypothetical protein
LRHTRAALKLRHAPDSEEEASGIEAFRLKKGGRRGNAARAYKNNSKRKSRVTEDIFERPANPQDGWRSDEVRQVAGYREYILMSKAADEGRIGGAIPLTDPV